jgi:hypothetical protein
VGGINQSINLEARTVQIGNEYESNSVQTKESWYSSVVKTIGGTGFSSKKAPNAGIMNWKTLLASINDK